MKATSVGEYLILFGALIAVVGTAVISLGRLIVFQAETAEEKYSQSIADELASVINEVAASPDGSYYVLEPTRTSYNITLTTTKVVLERGGEQIVATHLGRNVIPVQLDSTDTLCIQKSLGKILMKKGECLSCTNEDGFCDAGCDALGICDTDCIVGGDDYCSKSCSVLFDNKCDLDCVGKLDGIWDADCGCRKGDDPETCIYDDVCDPDSEVLDFAWDPECTGNDGVCDPDYNEGCDPDCARDKICRGTCASDPSICFPACNNSPCQNCKTSCAPGCSKQPAGWDTNFTCRGELPDFSSNHTYPLFLRVNTQQIGKNCSINATDYRLFYLGKEQPVGEFFEQGYTYLVYTPQNTGGYVYFDKNKYRGLFVTDLWAAEATMVNKYLKIKVEDGTITQVNDLEDGTSLGQYWGKYDGETSIQETTTSSNLTVAEINIKYANNYKKYQMFTNLPGVRLTSNYNKPCRYKFPLGYEVWDDGIYGYAQGLNNMIVYCGGASVNSNKENRELSCTAQESWIFTCVDCQKIKNWITNHETNVEYLITLQNSTGYSQYC